MVQCSVRGRAPEFQTQRKAELRRRKKRKIQQGINIILENHLPMFIALITQNRTAV